MGALPINYPNAYDRQLGRTGSGIWLHGTPRAQNARSPRATNGCVVLANPDVAYLMKTVAPGNTPVMVSKRLTWKSPAGIDAARADFARALAGWQATHLAASAEAPTVLQWTDSQPMALVTHRLRAHKRGEARTLHQHWVQQRGAWRVQIEVARA